jgi:hypothetical protein
VLSIKAPSYYTDEFDFNKRQLEQVVEVTFWFVIRTWMKVPNGSSAEVANAADAQLTCRKSC